MTLNIELTPEQEAQLTESARRKGLDPASLITQLLAQYLPTTMPGEVQNQQGKNDKDHFYFTATPEEFDRALDDIAEMNRGLPVLPPEAFDRENLYDERF